MTRPRVFDVTHLVSRFDRQALTGIDRVDLAYARHVARCGHDWTGLHYGWNHPHGWNTERVRTLVAAFEGKVRETGDPSRDEAWRRLQNWIVGTDTDGAPAPRGYNRYDWRRLPQQCAWRVVSDAVAPPRGAVYLNVAQCGFEFSRFFDWMKDRPDVLPVFFVHDLLPLDLPEYFRDNYRPRFERRLQTILTHAKALIVSSDTVRERLDAEYRAHGQALPPTLVAHLPSPLGGPRGAEDEDAALAATPYFVMTGTIEPRKNHRLVLDVWQALGAAAPKLVLVGNDGWDHEHVQRLLTRSPTLRSRVRRVSRLARPALRRLVANARAVLAPSFAEGYGLPVIEAASLGTPVIASDIPVFREVAGGFAQLIAPLDGLGWKRAVEALADSNSPDRAAVRKDLTDAPLPTHDSYFARVESFLATL